MLVMSTLNAPLPCGTGLLQHQLPSRSFPQAADDQSQQPAGKPGKTYRFQSYSVSIRFNKGFGLATRPGGRTPGPVPFTPRSLSICETNC